jgi:hypothetical protein
MRIQTGRDLPYATIVKDRPKDGRGHGKEPTIPAK